MRVPLVLIAISIGFTACATHAERESLEAWGSRVTDEAAIQQVADDHEVYLRLVAVGSWGPENAVYEVFSDSPVQKLCEHDYSASPLNVVLGRCDYESSDWKRTEMNALSLVWILESLDRNDLFSLPKSQSSVINAPPRIEDPYDIVLFVKVGTRQVYVRRVSWHDLLRAAHNELRKTWANQSLETTPEGESQF